MVIFIPLQYQKPKTGNHKLSILKTLTIDGFYSTEEAIRLSNVVASLQFNPIQYDLGTEIENFNLVPENCSELFSSVLHRKVIVDDENSGSFRIPKMFIHFEDFYTAQDLIFVVAVEPSTFNIFEHKSGAENAIQGRDFVYRNLFEWDLTVNYLLKPGQGVFFRPWLFHSFNNGIIQMFRLKEVD